MSIIMVDDPTFKGKGPAPKTIRSWAMRTLHEGGTSVGDIARFYNVTYSQAYRAINPERQYRKRQAPAERDLEHEKLSVLLKLEEQRNPTPAQAILARRASAIIDRMEADQGKELRPTYITKKRR